MDYTIYKLNKWLKAEDVDLTGNFVVLYTNGNAILAREASELGKIEPIIDHTYPKTHERADQPVSAPEGWEAYIEREEPIIRLL